jgi:hypothetical protein
MHPKTVSRFSDGFFVRDGGQGHFGLEFRTVLLAFIAHVSSLPFKTCNDRRDDEN